MKSQSPPAIEQKRYLVVRRWETRLMITYIVAIVMAGVWALLPLINVAITNTSDLPVSWSAYKVGSFLWFVGLSLYASILRSRFIRSLRFDYAFVDGYSRLELMLPFASFGVITIGLLSRWMKRMGFASLMRTVVPGLLAWVFLLPLSAFSATTGGIDPGFLVILQPLVLLLCVFAAFLCVWRENWMFMIPMLLAVIVALAGLFAMAIDA